MVLVRTITSDLSNCIFGFWEIILGFGNFSSKCHFDNF